MEIREEKRQGVLVVAPAGRLDSGSSGELERRLLERLSSGERRMLIDLRDVEYISSAGLRVLLLAANRLRPSGQLVLCSLGRSVREVFELAGFLPIFRIEPSLEPALAVFEREAPGGAQADR